MAGITHRQKKIAAIFNRAVRGNKDPEVAVAAVIDEIPDASVPEIIAALERSVAQDLAEAAQLAEFPRVVTRRNYYSVH
jgi:hypothetical protein